MNKKPSGVFYGWWVVVASFFTALYVGGAVFYGFTAFFEPIAYEFGWSYTQISLAAALRGLEAGLLAPLVGILVDRWGPRRLIFGGVTLTAIGLILLSNTTSLGMFYGAFALMTIGLSGCAITVLMAPIANWFHRKVGLASGIALSGFGFSGLLVPAIVALITMYEWRVTMIILALGMLVTLLPLSLLFRHKPEQYGYLPDGQVEDQLTSGNASASSPTIDTESKTRHILKNSSFWRIALSFTIHLMLVATAVTHVMPYLSSIGIARSASSLVATAIPLVSISGRLGLGWLGDRFDKRKVTATGFAMMGLGLLCFGYAGAGTWLLVLFLIFFGIGYGGINAMRPSLVRQYFGRAKFGAVFGLLMGINMLGAIIGPPLAGWVYDTWGNYQSIWFIFASLPIASIISILTISPVSTVAKPTGEA